MMKKIPFIIAVVVLFIVWGLGMWMFFKFYTMSGIEMFLELMKYWSSGLLIGLTICLGLRLWDKYFGGL